MKFCPNCDNIMDIGRNILKANILNIETPTTISEVTTSSVINTHKKKDDVENNTTGAYWICKNCAFSEKITTLTQILNKTNNRIDETVYDFNKLKNLVYSKCLPHTREYICKNKDCISHTDHSKRDAVWVRPNPKAYNIYYVCCACQTVWKAS